ncbi:MAG: DUF6092 family protein [Moorella sp. (in: firmicutes)]
MKEKSLVELFCFLLSSARGCVDEPAIYGPLRLIEAYSRLVATIGHEELDNFWWQQKEEIDNYKNLAMYDEEAFIKALDQTLEKVAHYISEGRIS